jgi:hypothetical protein
MLKVTISFNKKIPIPNQEYASMGFHSSMEKELADSLSPQQIQEVYNSSYKLLESIVDREIAEYKQQLTQTASPVLQQLPAPQYRSPVESFPQQQPASPQRGKGKASAAQVTLLNRIGAELGYGTQQVNTLIANQCGVGSAWELTVKQASALITQLSDQNAAA